MPRHLELTERAAHHVCRMETLCPLSLATYSIKPQIPFYLSLRTVTVGSLYLCGSILFSTEDTEVTDYFSVFCVLRGLILFSTEDTEVTDEVFSVFSVLRGLIFVFHGRHGVHG